MAAPLRPRERDRLRQSVLDGRLAGEPVSSMARRLRLAPATIYRWLRAAPAVMRADGVRMSRCEQCGGPVREPVR